jgi:hypothetical protein
MNFLGPAATMERTFKKGSSTTGFVEQLFHGLHELACGGLDQTVVGFYPIIAAQRLT